jgi:hypothetical protein
MIFLGCLHQKAMQFIDNLETNLKLPLSFYGF